MRLLLQLALRGRHLVLRRAQIGLGGRQAFLEALRLRRLRQQLQAGLLRQAVGLVAPCHRGVQLCPEVLVLRLQCVGRGLRRLRTLLRLAQLRPRIRRRLLRRVTRIAARLGVLASDGHVGGGGLQIAPQRRQLRRHLALGVQRPRGLFQVGLRRRQHRRGVAHVVLCLRQTPQRSRQLRASRLSLHLAQARSRRGIRRRALQCGDDTDGGVGHAVSGGVVLG